MDSQQQFGEFYTSVLARTRIEPALTGKGVVLGYRCDTRPTPKERALPRPVSPMESMVADGETSRSVNDAIAVHECEVAAATAERQARLRNEIQRLKRRAAALIEHETERELAPIREAAASAVAKAERLLAARGLTPSR
jgi:hypothetical protein